MRRRIYSDFCLRPAVDRRGWSWWATVRARAPSAACAHSSAPVVLAEPLGRCAREPSVIPEDHPTWKRWRCAKISFWWRYPLHPNLCTTFAAPWPVSPKMSERASTPGVCAVGVRTTTCHDRGRQRSRRKTTCATVGRVADRDNACIILCMEVDRPSALDGIPALLGPTWSW